MDKIVDNSEVKKVMTFKSGNFVFSRRFDEKLIGFMNENIEYLYKNTTDIPILPSLVAQLEPEIKRKSVHGTAAIEGNPLTEEEVGEIINRPKENRPETPAELEIHNLLSAYAANALFVKTIWLPEHPQHYELRLEKIKDSHRIITNGLTYSLNEPGIYRNERVQVGDKVHGGIYTPPKTLPDIQNLMVSFEEWINSSQIMGLPAIIRAALAHYHFARIHPFGDGNGRTARLIEAILLQNGGFDFIPAMLSNYYYKNLDEYYSVFSVTRKCKVFDMTPFLKFVLTAFQASLYELKSRINDYIRKLVLEKQYNEWKSLGKINQRQYDLLELMLQSQLVLKRDELQTHSLTKLIFRDISNRTVARDIKNLIDLNLLNRLEDDTLELNVHRLG